MAIFKLCLSATLFLFGLPSFGYDAEAISRKLATDGLLFEVHGGVPDQDMIVLTLRDPENFFKFEHFSAVGQVDSVQRALLALGRHDKILVKGALIDNRSKQGHVEVASFEVKQRYRNPLNPGDYPYEGDLPLELQAKGEAEFLVHAVHQDGEVLVLEFKDRVVPVFVRPEKAGWTRDLARNDVVRVRYSIARHPERPMHLRLDAQAAKPIEVLDSVMAKHGLPADVTGELVLFPKSPQVSFDVFAISEPAGFGLKRQYTLINFDDPELFRQIREKCAAAWTRAPQDFRNGRTKLIHNTIRFRARGTFNEVDANQANVQILIDRIDALEWVNAPLE